MREASHSEDEMNVQNSMDAGSSKLQIKCPWLENFSMYVGNSFSCLNNLELVPQLRD